MYWKIQSGNLCLLIQEFNLFILLWLLIYVDFFLTSTFVFIFLFFLYLFKDSIYLFMRGKERERERKREADTGWRRSRLHAGSPTWDSIPGLQDQALGWGRRWTAELPGCPLLLFLMSPAVLCYFSLLLLFKNWHFCLFALFHFFLS